MTASIKAIPAAMTRGAKPTVADVSQNKSSASDWSHTMRGAMNHPHAGAAPEHQAGHGAVPKSSIARNTLGDTSKSNRNTTTDPSTKTDRTGTKTEHGKKKLPNQMAADPGTSALGVISHASPEAKTSVVAAGGKSQPATDSKPVQPAGHTLHRGTGAHSEDRTSKVESPKRQAQRPSPVVDVRADSKSTRAPSGPSDTGMKDVEATLPTNTSVPGHQMPAKASEKSRGTETSAGLLDARDRLSSLSALRHTKSSPSPLTIQGAAGGNGNTGVLQNTGHGLAMGAGALASPLSQSAGQAPGLNPKTLAALNAQLYTLHQAGGGETRINLHPSSLGAIQINLQTQGQQQAQVTFSAANGATAQAIQQGLPALAASMQQQGIQLTHAQVNTNADGGSQNAAGQGGTSNPQGQGHNQGQQSNGHGGENAPTQALAVDELASRNMDTEPAAVSSATGVRAYA